MVQTRLSYVTTLLQIRSVGFIFNRIRLFRKESTIVAQTD